MTTARRDHKSRLFCDIFSYKPYALELYNAVTGNDYDDVDNLEITTLEDVLYLTMKNDVALLFHDMMMLFEHQSTVNPNMPLRGFLYYAREYEGLLAKRGDYIYGSKLVKIPTPQYYILYNGEAVMQDKVDFHLSDAFTVKAEGYEWTAHLINVNRGRNDDLMARSPALVGYAELIALIREKRDAGMELPDAVDNAVDACISQGILKEYLLKHKGEVRAMILTEYDEELHRRTLLEEGELKRAVEVYQRLRDKGYDKDAALEIAGLDQKDAEELELS